MGGQAVFCTEYADVIVLRAEGKRLYRAQLMDLLKLEEPLGWKIKVENSKITELRLEPFPTKCALRKTWRMWNNLIISWSDKKAMQDGQVK